MAEAGCPAASPGLARGGFWSISICKAQGCSRKKPYFGADALDVATLVPALDPYNPKRNNVKSALATVLGITVLDIYRPAERQLAAAKPIRALRDYRNRSGFPRGWRALGAVRVVPRPTNPTARAPVSSARFLGRPIANRTSGTA
jgi:hypothetical protein